MAGVDLQVPVADGVRLHARRWPGQRRPFLLVHGLSSAARLWDEVAEHLAAAGHPSVAVDLRSHGRSDSPQDGYDTGTAADDLAVVIDALDLHAPVAVGQSWGGNVVALLAARHPSLVAALALVDGGWLDLTTQFPSWPACAAALRPPDLDGLRVDDFRARMRGAHPDWSAAAIEATVACFHVAPDGTMRRPLPIDRHMSIVRSMWDNPPWPWFARIETPVLLVPAVPADPDRARRQRTLVGRAAATLPAATVREYVGADHDLHAQHPEALAADLVALARSLPDDGPR